MSDFEPLDPDSNTEILSLVRETRLPKEIWPEKKPESSFRTTHSTYRPVGGFVQDGRTFPDQDYNWLKIDTEIISCLQTLPILQMLGQATLVRLPDGPTAMVSIAEALHELWEKWFCELAWAVLSLIDGAINAEVNEKQCSGHIELEDVSQSLYEDYVRKAWRQPAGASPKTIDDQLVRLYNVQTFTMLELKRIQESHDTNSETALFLIRELQQQNSEMTKLLEKMKSSGDASREGTYSRVDDSDIKLEKLDPKIFLSEEKETQVLTDHRGERMSLGISKKDQQWYLCTEKSGIDPKIFQVLIAWLTINLGEHKTAGFPKSLRHVDLGRENSDLLSQEREVGFDKRSGSCWRNKIVSGNVLWPCWDEAHNVSKQIAGIGSPERESLKDGLILTAAALWSLFDNSLQRISHCQCTFKAAGGDYIQCRRKQGGWLLWHTFREEIPCDGTHCDENVQIALSEDEPGLRLLTTDPCSLGWPADGRDRPEKVIWKFLKVTAEFKQKRMKAFSMKEIQTSAQIGVPLLVSPHFSGAVTYSKRYYGVTNSIDHHSILAMELAAATVVLVYDERRRLHLTFDGADIIELCSINYLKRIGCDMASLPPFSHTTALLRLKTWYDSYFVSHRRTRVAGSELVRHATKKISELIETTKQVVAEEAKLPYWLLEDILSDFPGNAFKAPGSRHISWHHLAFSSPPLIFVVGEIDSQLLTAEGLSLRWDSGREESSSKRLKKTFSISVLRTDSDTPDGVVGSQEIIQRWVSQCQPDMEVCLKQTNDSIIYGEFATESEHTYEVMLQDIACTKRTKDSFDHCICTRNAHGRCLHYIQ